MLVKNVGLSKEESENLKNLALGCSMTKYLNQVVVRGAVLSCKAGSHCRYFNLLYNHGAMVGEIPVGLESDCIVGENIVDFGICAIKTMKASTKENFIQASGIPGTAKKGSLTVGIPCTPIPLGNWQEVNRNSVLWKSSNLQYEGSIMSNSILKCSVGDNIMVEDSGQIRWYEFWKSVDVLEDHEICNIKVKDGDSLQIKIVENTIEIHVYFEIEGGTEKQKEMIRKGIMQWEYKIGDMVFGHKPNIKVNLYEKKGGIKWPTEQKRIVIKCMSKNECLKEQKNVTSKDIDLGKRPNTQNIYIEGKWDYGNSYINMYPIAPFNVFNKKSHVPEKTGDGTDYLYDVRQLTEIEFINAVTHEFGHVMGLPEIDEYPKNFRIHGTFGKDDIMATLHFENKLKIYGLDFEMIITAAYSHKMQNYSDYSKLELIRKRREKCKNVKEES